MEEFRIVPLTTEYLEESILVLKDIFEDEEKDIRIELEASVVREKFEKYVKNYARNMVSLCYFIAVNSKEAVLGTIGLYEIKKDVEDSCWVGWYCVKEEERGKGIGIALLEYAIEKARIKNKKYLKLYTSTYKDEAKAQGIYEKYEFYITKVKKKRHHYILYRKKVL